MTDNELREIFRNNIKKYRTKNNWSQVKLAKMTGVSINFINDIESGKKWASPVTLVKLANTFDIQVYELLKPPNLYPDNLNSILKEYNDTIHGILENTRRAFTEGH
ncbi:MAG: helix-turn-helix domain-containing protein [Treponema sp.]|nr:helix-turn-helix domain-containing protein [Treponema sp.]